MVMRSRTGKAAAMVVLAVWLSACKAPQASHDNPMEIAASEYPRMYYAAVDVLRTQRMGVGVQDYRFGQVISQSQALPTMPEFWRRGRYTLAQATESTLNQQRRTVTVSLEPAGAKPGHATDAPPASYMLHVEAIIEQMQTPTRFLSGSTSGHRVMSELRAVPTELKERGLAEEFWQPLGRDTQLEQELLALIVRRSLTVPLPDAATQPQQAAAP
ncbi:MAG: hypothetical protein IT440_10300 [Phycisphaeraceae bacterium]|nr:hypothetical protein [Phycisphaeraceae bacterium]